ncbi:MAG: DUF3800 domain-containing protein [Succinivibrio sp.]|nr:DUF3800 domain-containing protein [Succinivibrio sp.]
MISNKEKSKLFRSLNQCIKFGVVIKQQTLHNKIFSDKKTKQRYLDWAFKMGIKNCFLQLIKAKIINPQEVKNLHVFADEHSTATNGRYELEESLEQEFKIGIFNQQWNKYHESIFPRMNKVEVKYCDSKNVTLVKAADIVANKIFYILYIPRHSPYT